MSLLNVHPVVHKHGGMSRALKFNASNLEDNREVSKEKTEDILNSYFAWTANPEDRLTLWKARHDAVYATKALRPGAQLWPTDVCVPLSDLAECITETEKDLAASFLRAPIAGHVGDGNFHLALCWIRTTPGRSPRPNDSTIDWSVARWH